MPQLDSHRKVVKAGTESSHCLWQVPGGPNPSKNHGTVDCGSTEDLHWLHANRPGAYPGFACMKHLAEAWVGWNADYCEPLP